MPDTQTILPATPRFADVRGMARGWWVFILRGLAAIGFGLLAFLAPGASLALILGCLAAWMVIDGAGTFYQAITGRSSRGGAWVWVDGVISLGAAVGLLVAPGMSALALVFVTGFWAMAVGVVRLVLAFRLGSVLMGLLGGVTVLFGGWLVAAPEQGLLTLIWIVGIQALLAGGLLIGIGWRLRRVAHDPHGPGLGRG